MEPVGSVLIILIWSQCHQFGLDVRPLYEDAMLVVLLAVEVAAPVQHHHVQVQVALLLLLLEVLMLDAAAFSPSSLVVSLRLWILPAEFLLPPALALPLSFPLPPL